MNVKIEKQGDGTYIAYNTTGDNVTLIGTGDTVAEAKKDFEESLLSVKESYEEMGDFVPEALSEKVVYKFDLSSLFEYYKILNISAFARYVGINDSLMRQYKKGNVAISDKQLEKIEDGIHTLGKEMMSLRLV